MSMKQAHMYSRDQFTEIAIGLPCIFRQFCLLTTTILKRNTSTRRKLSHFTYFTPTIIVNFHVCVAKYNTIAIMFFPLGTK